MAYNETHDTWDLSALQNILCGFAPTGRITKTTLRRLARYISYHMYDTESKYNINKTITKIKANTSHHKKYKSSNVEISKSLESMQGIFYINADVLAHFMELKNLIVNVETTRAVFLKLIASVGILIEKFVKEGGMNATDDWWDRKDTAKG